MIHYLVQTVAFQLVFLLIYDLLLRKETFFNLNRVYLLVVPLLSLVLPFIKIQAFKQVAPEGFLLLPEVVLGETTVTVQAGNGADSSFALSPLQWILLVGALLSLLFFIAKLWQIQHLKNIGKKRWYADFTEIIIPKSDAAFSFFKNIFLGDAVKQKEHGHIVEHELVHVKQGHSWDLLYFELLRIVFWFNRLVYVFQGRAAELHEFIADAKTAKPEKKEQYQLLLQEVFKTERISFINQFFKSSLIKKRIVMLQKPKSKSVWQLKYLLLAPAVVAMLSYTSCEKEVGSNTLSLSEDEALKKRNF